MLAHRTRRSRVEIFLKTAGRQATKKAHRWYASFCENSTFRFNFRTFRSMSVARFVLRIIYVNGAWFKDRSAYTAVAGWGNSSWSVQARLTNPFRWNWRASKSETTSPSYDVSTTYFNTSYHCNVLLSATYTFGFGKKIQHGNEASQQMGTSSSILK